jgi:hypothetical protein
MNYEENLADVNSVGPYYYFLKVGASNDLLARSISAGRMWVDFVRPHRQKPRCTDCSSER